MADGTTYQGLDGTTYCAVVVKATAPATNFQKMQFGYCKSGGGVYTIVEGKQYSGSLWKARIDGLVPGMSYDIVAISVNNNPPSNNSASCAPITIIAAGDTAAPAVPTGLTGNGKLKTWSWTWAKNTATDLKQYRVQVATNSNFTNIIYGADGNEKYVSAESFNYTDDSLGYGSLYCRVQAVDFSGNASAWNAGAMAYTTPAGTTDIATGGVQTGNISDSQVTTAKRQEVETQSSALSIPANSYAGIVFNHSLGRQPLVMPSWVGANGQIAIYVSARSATQFTVMVYNPTAGAINGTVVADYW